MGTRRRSEATDQDVQATPDLSRSVLDSLLEGCQVIGPDYRYLYVNEAVLRHARAERAQLLGRTMMECYPGIESTEIFATLRYTMTSRRPALLQTDFTFPDGSHGYFELRFEPVPAGVAILSVEISELKRTELALRRTMQVLTTISRCNQILARTEDETTFASDVCRVLVDEGGYRWAAMDLSDSDEHHRRIAESGRPASGQKESNPATIAVNIANGPVTMGVLTVQTTTPTTDTTAERSRLQQVAQDLAFGLATLRARVAHARTREQLIASQRLEAVGRLAGGVAHDFNNLLSVILSYTDLTLQCLPDSDPLREDIGQIRAAGERATALTRQLLAFSRKQLLEPQVIQLNDIVRGIEAMLRRLLGEDIDIEVHLAPDLGTAMADPGQIEQVIMNLAVNARDAMPDGGRLTIETANAELDGQYTGPHPSAAAGQYIRLSVADTGVGMSEEIKHRIFEPFFTTKDKGKGTGLGLSTVYGIVKQSGGTTWVYSEPGHGTTFKVYLPRTDALAVTKADAPPVRAATGDETILLVEDDDAVRQASFRILEAAGYTVLGAASGAEALALGQEHRGRIALLFTDVIMPEMNGRELAKRLMALNPDLKVLFSSGYTDRAIVHHRLLDPGTHFIGKPFSVGDLTRKVREVLDSSSDR